MRMTRRAASALKAGVEKTRKTTLTRTGPEQLARGLGWFNASRSTTKAKERSMKVLTAVTVARPRDEVYSFWRQFENLPRFMIHLESVEETGPGQSRWVAKAPAGRRVEWEAKIAQERPGELLAWRSLPGSDVENAGTVRFLDAPGDQGTEIHLDLSYEAPGGAIGDLLAKLSGEHPKQQVKDDLRRCKQVLETGEIVVSEGNPAGVSARQQLFQRPAQPLEREREPAVG
jgi:uncharacterized membrane protein